MEPFHAVEPDVESGTHAPVGYLAVAFAIVIGAGIMLHNTRPDVADPAAPQDTHARCVVAQSDLHQLELGGRVHRIDDSGERIYMQDDQRPEAIELAKLRVVRYCPR